jgi:LPS sulfotransferase NodH
LKARDPMAHTHRFCVVAQARSGSEYITTRLNAHPDIACHRELFNRHRYVTALGEKDAARLPPVAWRDAHPIEALEQIVAASAAAFPAKRLFGFKVFFNHEKEVRQHVRDDPRYKLILLERRNKLAQYASLMSAKKTGHWSAFAAAANPPPRVTVRVDLGELDSFISRQSHRYEQFRLRVAGRADVLEIHSEELDDRFGDVLRFLEVDPTPTLPVLRVRQNPDPLAERVENWGEVVQWLAASGRSAWAQA